MQTKQIVNTLMLDDATAAKFTPVYEKYLKELRECRMMTHKARTEKTKAQGTDANAKKERPSMTDDEIATMLRNQFTQSRKMLDVREKYYNEFSKILSQKQILKIYQQEKMNANKFRKNLTAEKVRNRDKDTTRDKNSCSASGPEIKLGLFYYSFILLNQHNLNIAAIFILFSTV